MQVLPSPQLRAVGSSLVDVMFAISMVAFACASLFLLYSNALRLLQAQQETEAATLALQERVEQLRTSNWGVLTSSASLISLINTPPRQASLLPGYLEDVTINAYPIATTPLHLRSAASGATVIAQNAGLLASNSLRVDVRVTWQRRGRTHLRENSLVVTSGGIVR